jgi:uncharacterized membrane protein
VSDASQERGAASFQPDATVERLVGGTLRAGVVLAAAVVLIGGMILLVQEGGAPAAHRAFVGEPVELRRLSAIVGGALRLDGRSVIQAGLLVLVATPIVRVALSLVAFARQRDRLYVAITGIVLALLTYSLLGRQP